MPEIMPTLAFRMMAAMFKLRDRVRPRSEILADLELNPGMQVLDFGCGPGTYIPALLDRVGRNGRVYALDIHPEAIKKVTRLMQQNGWENVEVIRSNCQTALEDKSLDVVLLFDIFHMLEKPLDVLRELQRVLKPDGVIYVLNPHMKEAHLIAGVKAGNYFRLKTRKENCLEFEKV